MTPDETTTPPEPGAAAHLADLRAKARFFLISLAVLVLDQWTKQLVETHLSDHASIEVIPGLLNFTHVRNTGVAFGMFATGGNLLGTVVLTLLGLAALVFVGYYFRVVPRHDRQLLIALTLVMGGAVGNLLDRIARGAVTDFVDFYYGTYHWHTFNVADSAISVGIGLMILGTFRRQSDEAALPAKESPSGDAPAA
jgi:signal peptidase II